jgi:glutamate synthase (NADPH) small chain
MRISQYFIVLVISGDVVNGARTVVEAVAHSKIVAESMHEYMQSLKDSTD